MNLDKEKRSDPKPRSNFKNVAINLPKNNFYEETPLRPRINRADELKKLADEIQSTPTAIVNLLIDVGLEVFNRTLPILKDDIKKTIDKKLIKLLK